MSPREEPHLLSTNTVAPDFELPNQFGELVRLSQFRGVKQVALVFFPLAFTGVHHLGERFVDMSSPYDKEMNAKFEEIAKKENITLHKGVYAAVMGPQLETRAEYRYLKIIGADAVGMSTVPEVIVANHLGLPVSAVSVITDEGDPDNLQPVNISEIIAMAQQAEPQMIKLFRGILREI